MAFKSSSPSSDATGPIYDFPPAVAKDRIRAFGAFVKEDASAACRVSEFINRNYPFKTPEGLEFCARNSLYDKDIRIVIESSLDRPYWGSAKGYSSDVLSSNEAYFFLEGDKLKAIYILLYPPQTTFLLFEGSHNKGLPGKRMSRLGLFTLPQDQMKVDGIKAMTYHLAEGGFALIDGRIGWTILGGQKIAIGYASEAEVTRWGNIELGDTVPLKEKVSDLSHNGIKAKFVFIQRQDSVPKTQDIEK